MGWSAVAAVAGSVVSSYLLDDDDDAPKPDKAIGRAATANSDTSREALEFAKLQYEEGKPRQAAFDELVTDVVGEQMAISEKNQFQADEQWSRFKTIFAPVEERMVSDAMTIDSPEEMERAAGEAATRVQSQYDTATGSQRRQMMAMGLNPNSGRMLAMENENKLGLAAAKAGAANNARLQARDRGISLRAGAANFGRNMPNTAANAYGIAVNSGSSAVNNQSTPIQTANANAATMNQGFNTAISGVNSAGNILNTRYGNTVSAWNAQQDADASSDSGLGSLVGQLGSAYITSKSSKKVKENKRPIDHGLTLKKVENLPVEDWKYKKGVEDGGEHVGPYAEDVKKQFGDKAAPGGKMLDMVSMMGITMSAVKGLAAKTDKIEKQVSRMTAATRGLGRA